MCTSDSLNCQGMETESGPGEGIQQLSKSAYISMTREAIQIETNRQLRLFNHKKEKSVTALVPVFGQSWLIKDVFTIEDPSCGKGRRRKPILRSNNAWKGKAGESLWASDDRVSYGWHL